ncbi:hypothetical protein O6H91_Y364100 [Diphasiastrum complanatum]|nr:hypothetical protein O6H91_Y364100 [Diphasiastrum complanatum]
MLHPKLKRFSLALWRRVELLFLCCTCLAGFFYLRSHTTFQNVLNSTLLLETFHVSTLLVTHVDPHASVLESMPSNSLRMYEKSEGKNDGKQIFKHSTNVEKSPRQEDALAKSILNAKFRALKRLKPFKAADMQELQPMSMPEKRKEWFKTNWASIHILQEDDISDGFAHRMKAFLSQCSLRFFTIWIAPLSVFGPREQVSLQSIFKAHPSACVTIISRSLDIQGESVLQPFWDRGLRVMAISPDLPFLFRKTPAQIWFKELKNGIIDPGKISFSQNLSNVLRLAVLYKYGGIYLDMDVIVLREMSNLANAIGAQSADSLTGRWRILNNAVLIFDHHHPLLLKFIQEFARNFNGSRWGHNGPFMVTRVVKQVQAISDHQCTVFPPRAFYSVDWAHIDSFFRFPATDYDQHWQSAELQQLEEEAYTLHLWNRKSRDMDLENGSFVDILFHRHCIFCKK